jgi:hypothetical protein
MHGQLNHKRDERAVPCRTGPMLRLGFLITSSPLCQLALLRESGARDR